MRRSTTYAAAAVLAVMLGVCVFAWYTTRDAQRPASKSSAAQPLVDTTRLQTVFRLAPYAATADEQAQAREAWRLADHEVDLAFAAELRKAQADASVPPTGPLRDLSNRIERLKAKVDTDKKRADDLTKSGGDGADVAQAQLDLDQDELDDSQQDLAREGGDKRARLQRLLQEHEASEKTADQGLKFGSPGKLDTLSDQLGAWLSLTDYSEALQAAARDAATHAGQLLARHGELERQIPQQPEAGASLARLRELGAMRKTVAGLDQRIQDSRQLASVYQQWDALAETRRRSALHLVLRSVAAILAILLAMVLMTAGIRRSFHQSDRRRLHQLRMIARISVQVAAVLLILLIVFGPPTQLSTVIGLVTAGLTVVMKDFIVAFFGWFALMGKNGISVGDWVEIEGVSGEVIEIGLLKTVLLELGNWTDKGHPTGRRVAFSNSFAMERHYFNFSTSGQWLWDELQVTVPTSGDPYETAEKIRNLVERETEKDAALAAQEWERATHQYGAREFSARPAVNLRPASGGLDVLVRYITRAPQRNAVKSKLYQEIIALMHGKSEKASSPQSR